MLRFMLPALLIGLVSAAYAADTPVNTHCPISGKPIDAALGCVHVKIGDGADAHQMAVGTCSKHCADMLSKNPEKYQVQVWATAKAEAASKHIKGFPIDQVKDACCNTTCPVDGKPISGNTRPLQFKYSDSPKNPYKGETTLVAFCSDHCREVFAAEPTKYEEPLWLQQKNKVVK